MVAAAVLLDGFIDSISLLIFYVICNNETTQVVTVFCVGDRHHVVTNIKVYARFSCLETSTVENNGPQTETILRMVLN